LTLTVPGPKSGRSRSENHQIGGLGRSWTLIGVQTGTSGTLNQCANRYGGLRLSCLDRTERQKERRRPAQTGRNLQALSARTTLTEWHSDERERHPVRREVREAVEGEGEKHESESRIDASVNPATGADRKKIAAQTK
jgi:hypothetical protein